MLHWQIFSLALKKYFQESIPSEITCQEERFLQCVLLQWSLTKAGAGGGSYLDVGLFWTVRVHLFKSEAQSFCPLKVSRVGNVGLTRSTAYRPWPGAFPLWRWDARHWGVLTTVPRESCPITAQNEPGERRDWAGQTKVMMERGRGLKDGK